MISKETINILLRGAQAELKIVEDALLYMHDEKGYSMCSDEFLALMGYRKDLLDEIEKLEKNIYRMNVLEEILKK